VYSDLSPVPVHAHSIADEHCTMAMRKSTDTGDVTLTAAGQFSPALAGQAENPTLASSGTDNPTLINSRVGTFTLASSSRPGNFTLAPASRADGFTVIP